MKCRIDIAGRKIWNDNNNSHGTRPPTTEIRLLRDGEIFKTVELNSKGDGTYKFPCHIVWKNSTVQYNYTIDEAPVSGYSKAIQGFNITNTLNEITISGTKIWNDNHNAGNTRPLGVTVTLWQNGIYLRQIQLLSSPAGVDTQPFSFEPVPFADTKGNPFVYTITENDVQRYTISIDGFNITNTLITRGFSFSKTSVATGLSLQGAVFEIRQNGVFVSASASDVAGKVSFSNIIPGTYQMAETQPPVGYMDNTEIYDVIVSDDGNVTINGIPATLFSVKNTPKPDEIMLRRATSVTPAYMAAPNSWPLNGTTEPDLYMLDKILITLPHPAILAKWAYGIQDEEYFRVGGGIDITGTYQDGFSTPINTDYTVYAMFNDGTDLVSTITINRLRDGSKEMPYLLIDFTTAGTLESSVPGIDQFTLYYMQGNGVKLTQHYEIYENIDMDGKTWEPIGPLLTMEFFTGSLYGNGKNITNLTVGDLTTTAGDYIGLFRFIGDGASIQKLRITNCTIGSSYVSAGFTAYIWIQNGGSILLKDLHFDGAIKTQGYSGGIVGIGVVHDGSLIIDGCTTNENIESNGYAAGGIICSSEVSENCSLSIINCYSSGYLISQRESAGIIGNLSSDGTTGISNCINAMKIESSEHAGGIVAQLYGSGSAIISSCYNKGELTGGQICGGIAGGNNQNSSIKYQILNCYNSGKINASLFGGGIYGYNYVPSVTQNCYNIGNISSMNTVGGIALNYGNTENCAALSQMVSGIYQTARISPIETSLQSVLSNNVAFDNMQVLISGVQKDPLDTGSSGTDGISVTTAEIKTQVLYETTLGWDFTNIWSFGNGEYALPILRDIPASLQPIVLPPYLA